MISNFSMAALYVKDNNFVNYAVLTVGFYYFSKQFESEVIKANNDQNSKDSNLV